MGRMWIVLAVVAACSTGGPASAPGLLEGALQADFGDGVTGAADAPAADTDQVPVYRLAIDGESVGVDAVDAVVDRATATLAWVDAAGVLWAAPLADAPEGARALAHDVILGLAARDGRVAFARRDDGPETAPMMVELATGTLVALDDGPGPDEVLAFSPGGDEVLLLSGRTGVASLFAVGVSAGASARQLTNVGLRPGAALDRAAFEPPPAHRRDVEWSERGLRYRAAGRVMEVRR